MYLSIQGYSSKGADDFKSGSNPANASLIKRFNQHSTMVLKSCDKKSTSTAASTTATAATGSSVETGVERLPKDVTVNGGIHVNAVISSHNAAAMSGGSTDAGSSDDIADKHVSLYVW